MQFYQSVLKQRVTRDYILILRWLHGEIWSQERPTLTEVDMLKKDASGSSKYQWTGHLCGESGWLEATMEGSSADDLASYKWCASHRNGLVMSVTEAVFIFKSKWDHLIGLPLFHGELWLFLHTVLSQLWGSQFVIHILWKLLPLVVVPNTWKTARVSLTWMRSHVLQHLK